MNVEWGALHKTYAWTEKDVCHAGRAVNGRVVLQGSIVKGEELHSVVP